jgi:hypothetical protein
LPRRRRHWVSRATLRDGIGEPFFHDTRKLSVGAARLLGDLRGIELDSKEGEIFEYEQVSLATPSGWPGR